jgi:hypothetical protein
MKQRAAARFAVRGLLQSSRAARFNAASTAIERRANRRAARLKARAMAHAARATAFHRRGAMRTRVRFA